MSIVEPQDMNVDQLEVWIDLLTRARSRARGEGRPESAVALGAELEDAWDHLRRRRAEALNGSTDKIVKRARVEREIEKLMGAEA